MVLRNDLFVECIMPYQWLAHRLRLLLPQRSAALDVSEEEGDSAGGCPLGVRGQA